MLHNVCLQCLLQVSQYIFVQLPEEMDIVRTCLGALRTSLSPQDPQQQTIDQLEQAMASLADQRLMSSPTNTTSPTPSKRHNSRSGRHVRTMRLWCNILSR